MSVKPLSRFPLPGAPVRGSETGKPIMALFDLLGRNWAMGVVWELSKGALTFRALQTACGTVSPSVLNKRIKELRAAGVVQKGGLGYELSERGQELFAILEPFGAWSNKWAEGLKDPSSK